MHHNNQLQVLLNDTSIAERHKIIAQKVLDNQRISFDEGVYLYQHANLPYLGVLANHIRVKQELN